MNKRVSDFISVIKEFAKLIEVNSVNAYSAQAAFYIMIAIFPFIMLIMTIIQYLPLSQNELQDILFSFMPMGSGEFLRTIMTDVHQKASGTLISVTAATTLWSASSGVYALMLGIKKVYRVYETRSYVRLKASSVIYTVFFIILLISTIGIIIFGSSIQSSIESQYPGLVGVTAVVISLRAILGIVVLLVFSLTMYILVPNRKTRVKDELPGAVVSAVGWIGFSYIYSFYINNFSNYSKFYGSMTAIVLLMLWLFFCMFIMLLGAQLNVFIQSRR